MTSEVNVYLTNINQGKLAESINCIFHLYADLSGNLVDSNQQ